MPEEENETSPEEVNETAEGSSGPTVHIEVPEEEPEGEAKPWSDPSVAEEMITKLRQEAAASRKKLKELEGEHGSATDATQRLTVENARLRVALETGIPLEVINSVSGADEEAIKQNVEALQKWHGESTKPKNRSTTNLQTVTSEPDSDDYTEDPAKMAKIITR